MGWEEKELIVLPPLFSVPLYCKSYMKLQSSRMPRDSGSSEEVSHLCVVNVLFDFLVKRGKLHSCKETQKSTSVWPRLDRFNKEATWQSIR